MNINHIHKLLPGLALLLISFNSHSAELTGRFSMLGATSQATQGDIGYINNDNILSADQQSVRLMLDDAQDESEWSLHIKAARIHLSNIPFNDKHSSSLFRYNKLSSNWLDENELTNATRIGYEVDRAVYQHNFKKINIAIGRQAIDWGSGRFWQPLNVFGAFSPTDLDTDYKQGIDVAQLNWFPSDFSSLTAAYVFSNNDDPSIKKHTNSALHYRKQIGKESEFALLAASIIGYNSVGASFESAWNKLAWRVEGAHYSDTQSNKDFTFIIAGADYQLNNGAVITAEWYSNSRGANSVAELSNVQVDTFNEYGLQQHLSKNVLGLSINNTISPLLNGGYTLLTGSIKNANGKMNTSLLHQINVTYSVSNESDILFSFQSATGEGLSSVGKIQSEFGHVPANITIRLRFYF